MLPLVSISSPGTPQSLKGIAIGVTPSSERSSRTSCPCRRQGSSGTAGLVAMERVLSMVPLVSGAGCYAKAACCMMRPAWQPDGMPMLPCSALFTGCPCVQVPSCLVPGPAVTGCQQRLHIQMLTPPLANWPFATSFACLVGQAVPQYLSIWWLRHTRGRRECHRLLSLGPVCPRFGLAAGCLSVIASSQVAFRQCKCASLPAR